MVQQHWDKIECEYALNEGGMIYAANGKVKYVGVATTEKVPRRIQAGGQRHKRSRLSSTPG